MSKVSRVRKEMGYEKSVPRCGTCEERVGPKITGRRADGIAVFRPPWCKTGDFMVSDNACCDKWHRKGEVLE